MYYDMDNHRYMYSELRERAVAADATKEDRIALGDWMSRYDSGDWNGECYDIDGGLGLWPVYEDHLDENGELDYADIIDYEIRRM